MDLAKYQENANIVSTILTKCLPQNGDGASSFKQRSAKTVQALNACITLWTNGYGTSYEHGHSQLIHTGVKRGTAQNRYGHVMISEEECVINEGHYNRSHFSWMHVHTSVSYQMLTTGETQ